MNDRELRTKVRKALDNKLSGLKNDPWLAQRVMNRADKEEPIMKKKMSLSLVLAIVAVLALGTALAVTLNTDFVNRVFGNDTRKNVTEHTEIVEDGKGGTYTNLYPSREFVAVDPETAERLLGDRVMSEPLRVRMGDHTLTVLNAVRDENAMVMDLALECPTGVRGLNYDALTNEGKGAWFADDAGYFFCVEGAPEMMYVDLENSTEECLRIYYYCVFLEKMTEGETPVLTAAAVSAEAGTDSRETEPQQVVIPADRAVPGLRFAAADGGTAELAPFSLRVCPVSGGSQTGNVTVLEEPAETVQLEMKNGDILTVLDPDTDETMYRCGGLGESFMDTSMVLNRLIDPAEVNRILVDGREFLPAE